MCKNVTGQINAMGLCCSSVAALLQLLQRKATYVCKEDELDLSDAYGARANNVETCNATCNANDLQCKPTIALITHQEFHFTITANESERMIHIEKTNGERKIHIERQTQIHIGRGARSKKRSGFKKKKGEEHVLCKKKKWLVR